MYISRDEKTVIREAARDDIPLMLELIRGLAVYENLEYQMMATKEKLERTIFDLGYAHVVIAEYEEKPVGFALFFFNYSTFLASPGLYLEDLFIKEEYRGNGVGKEIFRYLCGYAMEKDCGRVEWSCLDWNEPAKNFYRKLGAVMMDEWTVHRLEGESIRLVAQGEL